MCDILCSINSGVIEFRIGGFPPMNPELGTSLPIHGPTRVPVKYSNRIGPLVYLLRTNPYLFALTPQ